MQESGSYSSAMARACVSGPFAKKAYSPNTRASALPELDRAERPSTAGCGKCAATLIDHGTAGPLFGFGFLSDYTTVGTPSLRSLQGRDAMPSIRHVFVPLCEYSNSHPLQSARRMGHPQR